LGIIKPTLCHKSQIENCCIKIPASESSMGAGTANGKGMLNAVTTLPSNNNQMVMRPLKLKRLVVECNGQ
ncbi:MAG TPA: hypothetical protein PLW69_09005, partial [Agitococcus sp.]|nr:hypothetical protein [Agitococcus sp.]